jgi:hypothetical protein
MKKGLRHRAVAVLSLACAACGNPHGIYPVSGSVTYKDAPAAGASVLFQRQGADALGQQTIMGIVQPDGSFTVDCGALGKGAPPGEYVVLVEWKHDSGLPAPRSPAELSTRPDRLKGRYADPRKPLLHATVKAGSNTLPPFELTD